MPSERDRWQGSATRFNRPDEWFGSPGDAYVGSCRDGLVTQTGGGGGRPSSSPRAPRDRDRLWTRRRCEGSRRTGRPDGTRARGRSIRQGDLSTTQLGGGVDRSGTTYPSPSSGRGARTRGGRGAL